MKAAVCLYGYPRSIEYGHKALKHFLKGIEHDFFIHAWHDPEESGESSFLATHDSIVEMFNPVEFALENQLGFKRTFDFPHDLSCLKPELVRMGIGVSTFLSALYSIKRVGELLKRSSNHYDLVVLTRMDIFSQKALKEHQFTTYDHIYSSFCSGEIWDLNNDGDAIDLKLIASNRGNMEFLMNVYDFAEDYIRLDGIKVCHHRILAYHLKRLGQRFEMMFPQRANWFLIKNEGFLKGEVQDSHVTNYMDVFQ